MTDTTGGRPASFKMPIQGGMLEALGINMYTTLGKCLVEFVANAYDSEAKNVWIKIPHSEIDKARATVRRDAKAAVAAGLRDRFTVLLDTLPPTISVEIKDDGHGMGWKDVETKFLPLNRKRRADAGGAETNIKSENGRRFVMGRKGLGKLAGFGAAENVQVRTKRKGETFATIITLSDTQLKGAANVTDVDIPAVYEENLPADEQGTTITLSGLKSDAVKERAETLEDTLREAFQALRPDEFLVHLNEKDLVPVKPEYVFIYPAGGLDDRGYADTTLTIEDIGDVQLKYYIGFRPSGQSLSAGKRGARIYCNNRLAAGPSLFRLPTGMHNFHATDYLECIVEADELDRVGIDLINTNRTQLREDNEAVRALIEHVTSLMRAAINAHSSFRDKQTEEEMKADPTAQVLSKIIDTLPRKTRKPAGKLLYALAREHGVDSPAFQELAPAFINSVNATEVLVKLIDLRTKPETIAKVAEHLRELTEIERVDVLKLYRGRRDGIAALQRLWQLGEEEWRKRGLERELHDLLQANPWLIRPEFSNYLTSDDNLNKVVSRIAKRFSLDDFAPVMDGDREDAKRPDLTFLMSDPTFSGPYVINVVELKSPSLPLTIDHFQQLEEYLFQIKEWCSAEVSHPVNVRGFLIGAMPEASTTATGQRRLLKEFASQGANAEIRIMSLQEMLMDAWQVHIEAIKVLETEMAEDEDEDEDEDEGEDAGAGAGEVKTESLVPAEAELILASANAGAEGDEAGPDIAPEKPRPDDGQVIAKTS